jgi:hypothetical protein
VADDEAWSDSHEKFSGMVEKACFAGNGSSALSIRFLEPCSAESESEYQRCSAFPIKDQSESFRVCRSGFQTQRKPGPRVTTSDANSANWLSKPRTFSGT